MLADSGPINGHRDLLEPSCPIDQHPFGYKLI